MDENLSLSLSCDIVNIVHKKYLEVNYGIKYCSDKIYDGDIYDLYLRKYLVDSEFDCLLEDEDEEMEDVEIKKPVKRVSPVYNTTIVHNTYTTIKKVGYTHTQGTAADVWTITHNLGYYPNVTAVDSFGNAIEGGLQYVNSNTVKLSFSDAQTGKAYLS